MSLIEKILAAIAAQKTANPVVTANTSARENAGDQRHEVTVLFSDLSNYTKLINELVVEDIHSLLSDLHARFDGNIRRMGGTVVPSHWGSDARLVSHE